MRQYGADVGGKRHTAQNNIAHRRGPDQTDNGKISFPSLTKGAFVFIQQKDYFKCSKNGIILVTSAHTHSSYIDIHKDIDRVCVCVCVWCRVDVVTIGIASC